LGFLRGFEWNFLGLCHCEPFFEKRRGNPLKFFWGVGFGGGLGVLRGFWGIFVFYGWAWGFLVGFWGGLWIATPFL